VLNLNAIKNISNLRITNGFFASSRRDNKKQLVLFAYYAPLEEDLNQRFHRLRHFLVDNYDPIIIWALDKKGFNFKDSFCIKEKLNDSESKISLKTRIISLPSYVFNLLLNPLWLVYIFLTHEHRKVDICIACFPIMGVACAILKKLGKIKYFVYEDIDFFPGFYRNKLVKFLLSCFERIAIANSNKVICVSEELAGFRRKTFKNKNIIVIPNGVDYATFSMVQRERQAFPPTIVYAGCLGWFSGLDYVLLALALLKNKIPDITLILLGRDDWLRHFSRVSKKIIIEKNLQPFIKYYGVIPYRSLPNYLAKATLGLAINADSELRKYSCPLKIFEYAAAGLPVIGTDIGEIKKLIAKYEFGELVEYTPIKIADKVYSMLNDKQNLQKYSENAKKFAAQFDWNSLFDQEMEEIFRRN